MLNEDKFPIIIPFLWHIIIYMFKKISNIKKHSIKFLLVLSLLSLINDINCIEKNFQLLEAEVHDQQYLHETMVVESEEKNLNGENYWIDYEEEDEKDQRTKFIRTRMKYFIVDLLKLKNKNTNTVYEKKELKNKNMYEIFNFVAQEGSKTEFLLFELDLEKTKKILTSQKEINFQFYKLIDFPPQQLKRIQCFLIDILNLRHRHNEALYLREEINNLYLIIKSLIKDGFEKEWDYIFYEIKEMQQFQNLKEKIKKSHKKIKFTKKEISMIQSLMMEKFWVLKNNKLCQDVSNLKNTKKILNFTLKNGDAFYYNEVLCKVDLLLSKYDLIIKIQEVYTKYKFTREEGESMNFYLGSQCACNEITCSLSASAKKWLQHRIDQIIKFVDNFDFHSGDFFLQLLDFSVKILSGIETKLNELIIIKKRKESFQFYKFTKDKIERIKLCLISFSPLYQIAFSPMENGYYMVTNDVEEIFIRNTINCFIESLWTPHYNVLLKIEAILQEKEHEEGQILPS